VALPEFSLSIAALHLAKALSNRYQSHAAGIADFQPEATVHRLEYGALLIVNRHAKKESRRAARQF
jgi:hypothetical protein